MLICQLLLSIAPVASATPPVTVAPVTFVRQDEDDKPDKRPEIKDMIGALKKHVDKRGKEDQEAIKIIDDLFKEFPECGPKDRAAIIKGLSKCFAAKRQEDQDGVRDNKLYLASAIALGRMGEESTKALSSWIGHKSHRKDTPLQRQLILSLGLTKAESAIDTLLDLLKHSNPTLVGAAAEAIANFDGQPEKMRKEMFSEVLKYLMSAYNNAQDNYNDPIAQERIGIIKAPMITTLQTLSGHDERDPTEWQRWWNKNKKENWDKE